jgi:hypothetical protein
MCQRETTLNNAHQKALKTLAARNTAILNRMHMISLGINLLFFIVHFLFSSRSLFAWFILNLPALVIEFWFERIGRPTHANGDLKRSGEDLEAKGLTEWMWDLVRMGYGSCLLRILGLYDLHRREEGLGWYGWWCRRGRECCEWTCGSKQKTGKAGEERWPEDAVQVILDSALCDFLDTVLSCQWGQRICRKVIQTSLLCLERCATTSGFHLVPAGLAHVLAHSGAMLTRCDSLSHESVSQT